MNSVVILLGTNTGNLLENLQTALNLIRQMAGKVMLASSVYETEPWGKMDQSKFLNQVVSISTEMEAGELLTSLLSIENKMGRVRVNKWEPRTIDLDILYFNDDVIDLPGLTIPHQHLHERRFTLAPLAEIIPEGLHPVFKKTNRELLKIVVDDLGVRIINENVPLKIS